jgi:hypothetical protein
LRIRPVAAHHVGQGQAGKTDVKRRIETSVVLFFLVLVTGCASIGPGSVPRDRIGYANALSDSWKDQMLLNIVRLRYADAPTFMDVSSVISAYTLQAGVQGAANVNIGTPNNTTTLPNASTNVTVGSTYNDRPTISYTPLSGRKFAQSLLQPIPPFAIFSLITAGYPVDVVFPVTVRAFNGIYNQATQGGQTRPADPQFYPMVEAWQRIQASRTFSLRTERRGDDQVVLGVFAKGLTPEIERDVAFLRETLQLEPKEGEIAVEYGALQRTPNELAVLSRSMIEIMVELSAGIAVPEDHIARGRTFPTAQPTAASPRPHVGIEAGPTPPDDAFAAVAYRGTWYWVSDNDLRSKRAFTFLLLFFALAETGVTPEAPVLTIPIQ